MLIKGLGIRPTKMFDPTLMGHPLGTKVTGWQKRGWNKHTPKKRKKRAKPYGQEKSAKGRVKLRKGTTMQRRLQKQRVKLTLQEAAEATAAVKAAAAATAAPTE